MRLIQGSVAVLETGVGVGGLTVVLFARGDGGMPARVGSVGTDAKGEFRLEVDGGKWAWDLRLEVQAHTHKPTVLYADPEPRVEAGDVETWTIRIPIATLTDAGLLRPAASVARELPALGSVLARTVANQDYEREIRDAMSAHLDPRRATAAQVATRLRTELIERSRGGAPAFPTTPVAKRLHAAMQAGLAKTHVTRPRRGYAVVTESERAAITAATTASGEIPAEVIEPLLYGPVRDGTRLAIDSSLALHSMKSTTSGWSTFRMTPAPAPRTARGRPRFAIGDRVIDPWGYRGKVTGITHGLAAAAAAGDITDVDRWLRGLSVKPTTPRRGIWYTVRPSGGGEILVGELDLRRA